MKSNIHPVSNDADENERVRVALARELDRFLRQRRESGRPRRQLVHGGRP